MPENGIALAGALFPALVVEGAFERAGLWLLRFDEMPHFALLGGLSTLCPTPPRASRMPSARFGTVPGTPCCSWYSMP